MFELYARPERVIRAQQPLAWALVKGILKINPRNHRSRSFGPALVYAVPESSKRGPTYRWQLRGLGYEIPDDLPERAFVGIVDVIDCIGKRHFKTTSRVAVVARSQTTPKRADATGYVIPAGSRRKVGSTEFWVGGKWVDVIGDAWALPKPIRSRISKAINAHGEVRSDFVSEAIAQYQHYNPGVPCLQGKERTLQYEPPEDEPLSYRMGYTAFDPVVDVRNPFQPTIKRQPNPMWSQWKRGRDDAEQRYLDEIGGSFEE